MYFKQPRQLLDIFEELEEQNLSILNSELPGNGEPGRGAQTTVRGHSDRDRCEGCLTTETNSS